MSTKLYDVLKGHDPEGFIYKLVNLHFMKICVILYGMRNAVEIVGFKKFFGWEVGFVTGYDFTRIDIYQLDLPS